MSSHSMLPVIGMSPGNSYFKQEVVDQIIKKAVEEYGRAAVFIADIPAIATYVALGYPENRARRDKALPQGNALRNRVQKAVAASGIDALKVRVFDWEGEGIEQLPEYRKQLDYVEDLYRSNAAFKKDADAATASVLEENPFKKRDIGPGEIETAVHYLLSELAFMLFVPDYLGEGQTGYVYHRPWPVYENLIAGVYDGTPKLQLAFVRFPEFK